MRMRALWWSAPVLALASCARVDAAPKSEGGTITLPAPTTSGSVPLEQAIASRRSHREFGGAPGDAQLSQLLWAAQGITDKATGKRAVPSAGALYPLDVFVARSDGVFRYRPEQNAIEKVSGTDRRAAIARASLDQDAVRSAPILIVLIGTPARLRPKYGDRSERYMFMEAGHAAQNVLLEAQALGLSSVPVGAFEDDALREAIGAPSGTTPLYVLPIGRRAQ
jgi:SagB-type dehydrogenase family enzyme